MSSLRLVLRVLPFLCAAGAAGFALGRVDARVPKANDYEVFHPMYEAPDATEYAPWYPTTHLPVDQDFGSLPISGENWRHEDQAGQSWEPLAPAGANPKFYSGMAFLIPDGRLFLPGTDPARTTDSATPSPPTIR